MMKRSVTATALVLALALPVLAQAPTVDRDATIAQGRRLFFDRGCIRCHTLGVAGTPIAIDVSRMAQKYSEADLVRWLRDPTSLKAEAHMPALGLNEADMQAIAAFVAAQK